MGQRDWRFPLLALAGLSLLGALWSGILRLGWELPHWGAPLPSAHGPLMVGGFLGALIGLERAVALEKKWTYGAPLFAALGALALLFFPSSKLAPLLAAPGSAVLLAIFVSLFRRRPSNFFAVMGAGAFLWLAGNLLWAAALPLHRAVPWWIGFLVLMIAGERLELSRLLQLTRWQSGKFLFSVALLLCGLLLSTAAFEAGVKLCGAGLAALGLWLLHYDIAWRTIREPGLPRFMASALLCGYVWLVIGGLLWIFLADSFSAGPDYDAMLHSIFLGFVFSMIFAHAPIIFPSITGAAMPFQPAFYAHLLLLHLSLLLRVGADLAASLPWQQWGGLLNVLSILLFLANNVRAVRRAHNR